MRTAAAPASDCEKDTPRRTGIECRRDAGGGYRILLISARDSCSSERTN
jgi:hypothetical protein